MSNRLTFYSASFTDRGGRECNEDAKHADDSSGRWILADGLGGHGYGEVASATVIQSVKKTLSKPFYKLNVADVLSKANTAVIDGQNGNKEYADMKSTVVGAVIRGGCLVPFNVGDSRFYYFRNKKILLQSIDDSVAAGMIAAGMAEDKDVRMNPQRNKLTNVLGSNRVLNSYHEYEPIEISAGDAFLLCSDGFWEYVLEKHMLECLSSAEGSAERWLNLMLKQHRKKLPADCDNYTAVCGIAGND